jgi:hypothetical protein
MPVQTLDEFYAAAKIAKPIFEAIVNSIPEVYKICGNHDGDDDKKIIRVTLASSEDERRAQEKANADYSKRAPCRALFFKKAKLEEALAVFRKSLATYLITIRKEHLSAAECYNAVVGGGGSCTLSATATKP